MRDMLNSAELLGILNNHFALIRNFSFLLVTVHNYFLMLGNVRDQ